MPAAYCISSGWSFTRKDRKMIVRFKSKGERMFLYFVVAAVSVACMAAGYAVALKIGG